MRRGGKAKPGKVQRQPKARTKAGKAPARASIAELEEQLRQCSSELEEALQQQTATSEVLSIIRRSPADAQPVFEAIVQSATRLCDAVFSVFYLYDNDRLRIAALKNFTPEATNQIYGRQELQTPNRSFVGGRAVLDRAVALVPDVLEDAEYSREFALAGGWRAVLAVPLLRDGKSIGAITVGKAEPNSISEREIQLLKTFADQAVIAIENVRLFESVQTRTRELAESLEGLRTTQDRLVQTQKLASLGQLTAGIAHEMKNPLNFVNNFSTLSAELVDELNDTLKSLPFSNDARAHLNELTETLRDNLEKVVHHGRRADTIVKNMLLHSRESSGEHRRVDINAIVEESLKLAWHGARAEKQGFEVAIERSLDPTAGEVDIFPQDVTRALLNVIANGFYATTKRKAEADSSGYEPTLAASTKSLGDRVEIRIRDNGTGMPPDVKEKMFDPFFTTKPAGEGTGLGLSISHDIIVQQHAGSIEVETRPGEFTEIRVILPRSAVFV
jgi:two-component system, NtrC family, sensor kinase